MNMTKYIVKQPTMFDLEFGDVVDIKKLKHPVTLGDKKYNYIEVNTQHVMNKQFIKDNFTKGTYKSETPKRILKTLLILFIYEFSKYVTNAIIIKLQANDTVEQYPMDYEVSE